MVPDSTPEEASMAAAEPGAQSPGRPLGAATADGELERPRQSGAESDGHPGDPDPFSVEPPPEIDDTRNTDTSHEVAVDEPRVGTVFEEHDLDLGDFIQRSVHKGSRA